MNWSRAKSLFIVAFFCLNVFLLWQLMDKSNDSQVGAFQKADIETRLRANNITFPSSDEVKDVRVSGTVLKGKLKEFEEKSLESFPGQKASLDKDRTEIYAQLDEPVDIGIDEKNGDNSGYVTFLNKYVVENGMSYTFSEKYKYQVYFEQTFGGYRTVFPEREQAPLILYLDGEDRVTHYKQRWYNFNLGGGGKSAITYLTALEVLMDKQYVKRKEKITEIEFGYYLLSESRGIGTDDFVPAWKVVIAHDNKKEEKTYLVDAISRDIYSWPLGSDKQETGGTRKEQGEAVEEFNRHEKGEKGGNE